MWDGVVSILRLYGPSELLVFANETNDTSYVWRSGYVKSRFGLSVSYLIGFTEKINYNKLFYEVNTYNSF